MCPLIAILPPAPALRSALGAPKARRLRLAHGGAAAVPLPAQPSARRDLAPADLKWLALQYGRLNGLFYSTAL